MSKFIRFIISWVMILAIIPIASIFVSSTTPAAAAGTWTSVNPAGALATAEYRGVFVLDYNIAWIVGRNQATAPYYGVVYKTIDSGATWTLQRTGDVAGAALQEVHFVDANNGVIVGEKGLLWKTNDGGTTWTTMVSGYEGSTSNMTLDDVYMADATHGWIVGGAGTGTTPYPTDTRVILYTTDGWATKVVQAYDTLGIMKAVDFVSATTGWAWGKLGQIYYTTDAGTTWTPQTFAGVNNFLFDGDAWSASIGWWAGFHSASNYTSNGGTTWIDREAITTSGLDVTLRGIAMVDATTAYAVGASGTIIKSVDAGINWTVETHPVYTGTYYGVWFANPYIGYAVGSANGVHKYFEAPPAPVADFVADDTSVNVDDTITFTDTSTNSPDTWVWDFNNDGTVDSTVQNPTHSYSSAGTYTVKLTVNNPTGSDDEVKTNFITVVLPPPVANFSADKVSVLIGDPINFTDLSTYGPTSWAWDFDNNGTVDDTIQNPIYSYSAAGTYTVKLTATNSSGPDDEIKTDYITVLSSNTAPLAVADSYTTNEDVVLNVAAPGVLGNDTDADSDPLTAIKVTDPGHGTVTLNTDGSFSYTPVANYNGSDSFTYKANDGIADSNTATVTITITAVNDAPVAVNDGYSTNEDTVLNVTAAGVLSNDSDPEGSSLTSVKVANPSHGTVTMNANGSFTYTPAVNYSGSDSFTYKANDGSLDSNVATVTITITAVNDTPVAVNDSYSATEDAVLNVAAKGVLSNDTDVDGNSLTAIKVSNPSHGTLTLNADGSFVYTPVANYKGNDSFTYKASDGVIDSNVATVTITVANVDDPIVAVADSYSTTEDTALTVATTGVLGNDIELDNDPLKVILVTNPAHGTVVLHATNGSFVYTPAANYNGTDSFTYRVNDGVSNSNIVAVTITINAVNDAPVAVNDSYSTKEDAELSVAAKGVLANDTDAEGTTLTAVKASDPVYGTLTFNADGSFKYKPTAGYIGSDSFTYKAKDASLESNVATVNITVTVGTYAPLAAFYASKTTAAVDEAIIFVDMSIKLPISWAWDFGDGTTSTLQNPTHTYTTAGTYTVKMVAYNINGYDQEEKVDYITVNKTGGKGCGSSTSADIILVGGILCGLVLIISRRGYMNRFIRILICLVVIFAMLPVASILVTSSEPAAAAGSWTTSTVSGVGPTTQFTGVFALDYNTAWIVGKSQLVTPFYGVVYKTTNGGATWTLQKTGTVIDAGLNEVHFTDANNGWIVGDKGILWKTVDGGTNWTVITNEYASAATPNMVFDDIYMIDATTGWIIGGASAAGTYLLESKIILKTTNGWTTFTKQIPETEMTVAGILKAVDFVSATTGWAWGKIGQIYYTTNGGTTWTLQTYVGANSFIFDGDAWNASIGWWVGFHTATNYTTNAGATWIDREGIASTGYDNTLRGIQMVDATTAYAVGASGMIMKSTNAGVTWAQETYPAYTGTFFSVDFANPFVGYAVGGAGMVMKYYEAPPVPVANFSFDKTTASPGETINFTDTSTGGPDSWLWDFGDGSTSNLKNPTHTYSAVGTYTVKLTATNASGTDDETKGINVAFTIVANFSANKTTVYTDDNISFTDSSSGFPTSWMWDFGDGYNSTLQNPSHSYNAAGIYTVKLTALTNTASDSKTLTNYITVSARPLGPVASFTASKAAALTGEKINFTDTSTNSPTTWAWDFDNNGTVDSTIKNPVDITYAAAGKYTVKLTVTNAGGSDTKYQVNLITVKIPAPVAIFTADKTSVTTGEVVTFTETSAASPTSWAWDFNDDGKVESTVRRPTYSYATPGKYTVTLTVTNDGGTDSKVWTDYITVTAPEPSADGKGCGSSTSVDIALVGGILCGMVIIVSRRFRK